MTKFISIKDSKGQEIVINVDSIAYFYLVVNQGTGGRPFTDIHFLSNVENKITFDIDFYEFKKLLGL